MVAIRIAMFSRTDIILSVTTRDRVGWTQLMADNSDPLIVVKDAGTWTAVLTRGVIYGFTTDYETSFLQSQLADVYFTNAKDPWPKPPPPPPPPYWNAPYFATRFESFLLTGATTPADPSIAKLVIQPAPSARKKRTRKS